MGHCSSKTNSAPATKFVINCSESGKASEAFIGIVSNNTGKFVQEDGDGTATKYNTGTTTAEDEREGIEDQENQIPCSDLSSSKQGNSCTDIPERDENFDGKSSGTSFNKSSPMRRNTIIGTRSPVSIESGPFSPKHTKTGDQQRYSKKSLLSLIKKYDDPILELVNEETGTIRSVTVEMVSNLFSKKCSTLLLFGDSSEVPQRSFDNKKEKIMGTRRLHSESTGPFRIPKVGYACKKGLKPEGPNQDDFFVLQVDDWALYGIFDGHGPCGHNVSSFVQKTLPFLILTDRLFETDPELVLKRSFKKTHHLLEALTDLSENGIDCSLSGTTATIVLHRSDKLYIAHVGDSRGVLAKKNGQHVQAMNMTADHKPTHENEKARIEASGGEVRQLEGDVPHRVFAKNRLYPGLAMSRALGDTIGSGIGVIPEPDIRVVKLTPEIEFIIVATDGVWEFISSQEAVDFICQKSKREVQKAADFLAYESWRRWIEEEENVVDDVTCLIVWLS